jgi:hypothetical protein
MTLHKEALWKFTFTRWRTLRLLSSGIYILKMRATYSSETVVLLYQTIPEDQDLRDLCTVSLLEL